MEETIIIKDYISYNKWLEWSDEKHEDMDIALLELWSNLSGAEIKELNIDIYTQLMNIISNRLATEPTLQWEWEGRQYVIQPDRSKWTFRAWIDIEEIIKQMGTSKAAPYILYILSHNKYESSDDVMVEGAKLGEMPFQYVLNVLNFFLLREQQLKNNLQLCYQAEDRLNQVVNDTKSLAQPGAGITPLRAYQTGIFLNRTMSLIDPSLSFSTISLSSAIKLTLKKQIESIWNKLKRVKDKLLSLLLWK